VRELPGCFASGFSLDELFEALNEAVGLYLEAEEAPPIRLPEKKDGNGAFHLGEMTLVTPVAEPS